MAKQPILGHRFAVSFLGWGNDNLALETRFKKVQGLAIEAEGTDLAEGGQNWFSWHLPGKIKPGTLTLERGFVVGSLVNVELMFAFSPLGFITTDVLVRLLGEDRSTVGAWYFHRAYPTKWKTSDLNADTPSVVIDTIQFKYTRMQPLRI